MKVIGNDHLHYSENQKADDNPDEKQWHLYDRKKSKRCHRDQRILTMIQLQIGDAR